MEGMSVRTLYINVISNLIILYLASPFPHETLTPMSFPFSCSLYLLDNDTSLMVMFSVGVGLAIEVWKVTRAARVTVLPYSFAFLVSECNLSISFSFSQIAYYGSIPYPVFTDKEDYVQSHTKDHDLAAMKSAVPRLTCFPISHRLL